MDIYVKVSEIRMTSEGFMLEHLNFTWFASGWTINPDKPESRLKIKLNFTFPLFVSPNEIQDILVVHFFDPNVTKVTKLFYSPDMDKELHPEWWTVSRNLKKQIPDTAITQTSQGSAQNMEAVMKGVLIMTFFINLVLNGAMSYMISMIRAL